MDHQNDNQPYTPYTPPAADIGFRPGAEDTAFIPGGRAVLVGNAFSWISDAWGLFKQQAGLWIGFLVLYMVLYFLLDLIPVIGGLIAMFVQVLFTAGVVYSCGLLRREGAFAFGDLFVAFNRRTGPLLIASLIALGLLIVPIIIGVIFIGGSAGFGALALGGEAAAGALGVGLIVGVLIMLVGAAVYTMAIWFAPALILMHDIAPVEALKMSFSACLKNILPGLVFFLVMTVLLLVSAIPLGLGLLVTLPMFWICYYASYHDIFLNREN
jgi:uncharacterized membrane protein